MCYRSSSYSIQHFCLQTTLMTDQTVQGAPGYSWTRCVQSNECGGIPVAAHETAFVQCCKLAAAFLTKHSKAASQESTTC
jgi:hypothetical protein